MSRASELFARFLASGGDASGVTEFIEAQPAPLRGILEELWRDYVAGADLMRDLRLDTGEGPVDPIATLRSMCRTDASSVYDVAAPLSCGGMGRIDVIQDKRLGRRLVRKVLPVPVDDLALSADRRRMLRFLNEVRITSRLQHPSIPAVFEVGIDENGHAFFTMPLVRGETLAVILERHWAGDPEWTRTRVVGILLDVCGALAYAHSRGVIHRDIKPENIMVGRFGETLVMDWGLARCVGQEDEAPSSNPDLDPAALMEFGGVTMDGDVVGTPAFMAPEQAVGDLEDIGPATDQYAMGAILYTLLAGRHPYSDRHPESTARQLIRAVRREPPTPLRELAPRAPVEMVAIAERAMARRPQDRYRDIDALAADLRAFLDQRAVSAYDAGGLGLLRLWVRRNRRSSTMLAAGLVILAGALVWVNVARARHQEELRAANTELVSARDVAAKRLVDMQRNVHYHTITSVAYQLDLGEDYGHLRAMLDGCPKNLREWDWRFLSELIDTSVARATLSDITEGSTAPAELRLSPDERLLALSVVGGSTDIVDRSTGRRRILLKDAGAARFDPAGERIAVLRGRGRLDVCSVSTGACLATIQVGADVRRFCWAKNGAAIVVTAESDGSTPGGLRLFDAGDGRPLGARDAPDMEALAVSAGGLRIAAGRSGAIQIFGVEDLAPQVEMKCPEGLAPEALAFAARDARVIAVFADHTLWIYDTTNGEVVAEQRLPGRQMLEGHAVFIDPSGQRVAYVERGAVCVYSVTEQRLLARWHGGDGRVSCPAFVNRPPGVLALVNRHELRRWRFGRQVWSSFAEYGPFEVLVVAVSPDGAWIAATGWRDETCVWDLQRGGRARMLPGSANDPKRALAFSPDGARLLVEGPRGRPVIWRLAPCGVERELDVRISWAGAAAWSPDGRWIWVTDERQRFTQVDLETGRIVVTPYPGRQNLVSFSPDGRVAYLATEGGAVAVENASLRRLWRALVRTDCVAVTADGKRLAVGHSDDGRISLLDAATGKLLRAFVGHRWFVNDLAFTPTGNRLLSVSYDGSIKVWEPFAGRQLLRLEPDGQPLQTMDMTPDGRLLVAAGRSGLVHMWRLP